MNSSLPHTIAMAPHAWDDRWLSRQHLISRLAARGWPMVYSHGPLHWWDRHTPAWQHAPWLGHTTPQDGVLLDVPGRYPPRWPTWPWWDRTALALHAHRLQQMLGTSEKTTILWLFHPRFWPYCALLKPRWVIYHVYDVYSLMDDWNEELATMEAALTARADLITTSSPGMGSCLPGSGATKARFLGNGADTVAVMQAANAPCPTDLAAIPQPRIGYVGTINAKLDLAMVAQVAAWRPDWHWVLIGPLRLDGQDRSPRDQEAGQAWETCQKLANVHYLGAKDRREIPQYLHHLEVLTICYRVVAEDWVVHGYPVKLHEYLATGKPVVAAGQQAIQAAFSGVVAIADTPEAWCQAIGQALQGEGPGDPESRRAVALANTWDHRVNQLEIWLQEMMGKG